MWYLKQSFKKKLELTSQKNIHTRKGKDHICDICGFAAYYKN